MNEQVHDAGSGSSVTPEAVAELLDVVASDSVDHALSDIEHTISLLRADAAEAAAARDALRNTPADVLRDALRLRAAAQMETVR